MWSSIAAPSASAIARSPRPWGPRAAPLSDEHSPKARPPARLPRPTGSLAPDMQARRDRTTCSLRLATTPRSHSSPARQHGQTAVGEMATGAELAACCVRLEAIAPRGRAWAAWGGPALWAWDLAGPTWPMPACTPLRRAIQACSSTTHSCDDLGESWRACRGCARSRRSATSPPTPGRGSPLSASKSYTP